MGLDNFKNLWFDAMVIDEEVAWVLANNFNAIFSIELENGKVHYITSIPKEKMSTKGLFYNILKNNDELILIPGYADNIVFYNIKTREFRFLNIDIPKPKFFSAVSLGKSICLVGNASPYIVTIDMKTLDYKILKDCIDHFDREKKNDNPMVFRKGICLVDEKIYIASCVTNEIVIYDCASEKVDFQEINCKSEGFSNISYVEKSFWLTSWNKGMIVKYNTVNQSVEEVTFSTNSLYYSSDIISLKNQIWIFPLEGNDIAIIDTISKNVELISIEEYVEIDIPHPWKQKCVITKQYKNSLVSFLGYGCKLLIIDEDTHLISEKKLLIEKDDMKMIFNNLDEPILETDSCINMFIDLLTSQ